MPPRQSWSSTTPRCIRLPKDIRVTLMMLDDVEILRLMDFCTSWIRRWRI